MLPRNHPDRIRIVFDDHRLVANAGLLLPATLARHLGLRELVDHHLDLGGAPGRANTGDKLMTLVASAMAGGDCIDAADVLRTGGTACTLGTFLRSFRWGHLDRVGSCWPGPGPLGPDPASRSPSTSIPPSARPTDWPRRAPATTAIPASGATTRCWPSPPARRACPGCARAGPTPPAAPPTSCGRRWDGCATPGPTDDSQLRADRLHRLVSVCRKMDGPCAQSHRGDTRGLWTPIPHGRRRRCGRDHLHSLPE